jgi:hypothetical protein
VLSNEHCPLFQKDLNWFQRLMYCSGVWSYIVGAITAPVFIAIPLITIWAGVFPIVVSWWAAGESSLPEPQFDAKVFLLYPYLQGDKCLLISRCITCLGSIRKRVPGLKALNASAAQWG